jgi:hypothetical protein
MKQTLGQYITSVNLYIDDFSDGEICLSDLVDYADGEASLSDLHATGVLPKNAAGILLTANGMGELVN